MAIGIGVSLSGGDGLGGQITTPDVENAATSRILSKNDRGGSKDFTRPACRDLPSVKLTLDRGHAWRPPFGLDRVGAPVVAHVEMIGDDDRSYEYTAVAEPKSGDLERKPLQFQEPRKGGSSSGDDTSRFVNVSFESATEEVAIYAHCRNNEEVREVARRRVTWPVIEAEAIAYVNDQINPVDLGAILVPHDWLLLRRGTAVSITAAVIAHAGDFPGAQLRVKFKGSEGAAKSLPLSPGQRVLEHITLPFLSTGSKTSIVVTITNGTEELWRKEIPTMLVESPPSWPAFGAVETNLRYDAPVPAFDPDTEALLPSISYISAWSDDLKDIVVYLPNGSRFVFWRGSSFVPFWASAYNTGVSYQWAENLSIPVHHSDGSVDLPEPLFDRELRYGRVQIVESTASRVHVRWTYELTDNHYNRWGDQAAEDYFFYPDSFGTRVLTVSGKPSAPYQLTEFIILTPQSAFPFEVLPTRMMEVLHLSGEKQPIDFPFRRGDDVPEGRAAPLTKSDKTPSVYRIFANRADSAPVVYFDPNESGVPGAYWPFYDRGDIVTPAYWGSHWPLSRGKWTHWSIDDGIHTGPAHNSIVGWPAAPEPMTKSESPMLDTLGRSQMMSVQRWVALIGKTDTSDQELLDWARSFSNPPALELTGARLDLPSYSAERRAIRLIAESPSITVRLKPEDCTVNPVFELRPPNRRLVRVTVNDKTLAPDDYTWDGSVLWVRTIVRESGASIGMTFR